MRNAFLTAAIVVAPVIAQAQNFNPSGLWRCVMNSQPVTIDLMVQVAPDYSLFGEGTYILNGTSAMYQIRGPGRWSITLSDAGDQTVVHMQFVPGNVPVFSIYPGWIGDPNALHTIYQDPSSGSVSETACQRMR